MAASSRGLMARGRSETQDFQNMTKLLWPTRMPFDLASRVRSEGRGPLAHSLSHRGSGVPQGSVRTPHGRWRTAHPLPTSTRSPNQSSRICLRKEEIYDPIHPSPLSSITPLLGKVLLVLGPETSLTALRSAVNEETLAGSSSVIDWLIKKQKHEPQNQS